VRLEGSSLGLDSPGRIEIFDSIMARISGQDRRVYDGLRGISSIAEASGRWEFAEKNPLYHSIFSRMQAAAFPGINNDGFPKRPVLPS
jgi:hypothetical protein